MNIIIYHLFMYLIYGLDVVQSCRMKTNLGNIGTPTRLSSSTPTGICIFVSNQNCNFITVNLLKEKKEKMAFIEILNSP